MISGMPTPTTWPSPRKLVTRTSFAGLAIVGEGAGRGAALAVGAGRRHRDGVLRVRSASAFAGRQVLSSLSSAPSTGLPAAS